MTTIQELKVALVPILLQCVQEQQRITYGEAADEIVRLKLAPSAHHRLIGRAVGALMDDLRELHGNDIPPLNCLVVNGGTYVASGGAGYYVQSYVKNENAYKNLSIDEKQKLLELRVWPDVYAYDWSSILIPYVKSFGMPVPAQARLKILDKNRSPVQNREADGEAQHLGFFGPAESQEHRNLKLYIRDNPGKISEELPIRPDSYLDRYEEYGFPSLDVVDVLYAHPTRPVVIEVKSAISNDEDLRRGIYQCVKYRSLLEAEVMAELSVVPSQLRKPSITAILVTERKLPKRLQDEADIQDVKNCVVRYNKHIKFK